MEKQLDAPRALLRGEAMKTMARIEHNGVPIDVRSLNILRAKWEEIKDRLINEIDGDYGVYDGTTFKGELFEKYLQSKNIPWLRHDSGKLKLDDETFRQMAKCYPQISPLRELRSTLSKMRLSDLEIGHDGRARCSLWPFGTTTGRCAPSTSKFIFGSSVWLRGLIKPNAGYGIAYIDWEQQEYGIAASLSKDEKMLEAYECGDPYLAFAKQSGAVPLNGTKESHGAIRELYKQCVLAVQYGMGEKAFGERIGRPPIEARFLLRKHRETYRKYWKWSDAAVDYASLYGSLHTVFGWRINVRNKVKARSLANFPMQANGAEILRLACILAMEKGVKICATIHDAILVEAPLVKLNEMVNKTQEAMSDASAIVLNGFRLRSEAKIFCFPDRFMDPRGEKMWETVWKLIGEPPDQSYLPIFESFDCSLPTN